MPSLLETIMNAKIKLWETIALTIEFCSFSVICTDSAMSWSRLNCKTAFEADGQGSTVPGKWPSGIQWNAKGNCMRDMD